MGINKYHIYLGFLSENHYMALLLGMLRYLRKWYLKLIPIFHDHAFLGLKRDHTIDYFPQTGPSQSN